MKKCFLVAIIISVLALSVFGCSNSGSSAASSTANSNLEPEYVEAYEFVQEFLASDTYAEITEVVNAGVTELTKGLEDMNANDLNKYHARLEELILEIPLDGTTPEKAVDFMNSYYWWAVSESDALGNVVIALSYLDQNNEDKASEYIQLANANLERGLEMNDAANAAADELVAKGSEESV